jgi:TPR repeat protein
MINLSVISLLVTLSQSPAVPPSTRPQQVADLKTRAEAGDPKAEVELGIAFASGDRVTADDAEAVRWFRRAAEKGDAAGEYSLAEMYLIGRGVAADLTEAAKWMQRSAEHGDPRGQFNLAVMYAQGQGVLKNDQEAAKWMRKAADQGVAAGQFGLGSMYAHGEGVPQSASEAARWYRSAAAQGDGASMNNLAFLLATSTDENVRNPNEAIAVGQKAVETDTSNAAFRDTLATAYFEAGRFDKAVETELRALALTPDNPSYKTALEKYQAALNRAPKR